MDFQNQIKQLAERIGLHKENIQTEEATKNAFVMPFLQMLGYDVFNPMEVIPEFTADVGIKKGEKVDYAILKDSEPVMIIECKFWKENLNNHDSQLNRYFHVSKAKFGILTNGIEYRFFTDLEENNKMDERPFLIFNFENVKDNLINQLNKFHKSSFDVDCIIDSASELKYSTEIRKIFEEELKSPSDEFMRLFAKRIYKGKLTQKVAEQFTEIIKKSLNQTFNEIVNDRLKAALSTQEEVENTEEVIEVEEKDDSRVVTTEEEMEGFHIVKSIIRPHIHSERIAYRDTISYFGILLDDNNRKPICRLHFNTTQKYIGLFDENKKENRVAINSVDDIYEHAEKLIATLSMYSEN